MGFSCWGDNHRFDHKLIHTFTAGGERIEFDRFSFLNFNFRTTILGVRKLDFKLVQVASVNESNPSLWIRTSKIFPTHLPPIWFNPASLSFRECQWIRQFMLWCWTLVPPVWWEKKISHARVLTLMPPLAFRDKPHQSYFCHLKTPSWSSNRRQVKIIRGWKRKVSGPTKSQGVCLSSNQIFI